MSISYVVRDIPEVLLQDMWVLLQDIFGFHDNINCCEVGLTVEVKLSLT